jgi:dGTPase
MYADERITLMAHEREVVADLVTMVTQSPQSRLDPDLRADFEAAHSDAAARRVVIDQVASLSDVRALTLHREWS